MEKADLYDVAILKKVLNVIITLIILDFDLIPKRNIAIHFIKTFVMKQFTNFELTFKYTEIAAQRNDYLLFVYHAISKS